MLFWAFVDSPSHQHLDAVHWWPHLIHIRLWTLRSLLDWRWRRSVGTLSGWGPCPDVWVRRAIANRQVSAAILPVVCIYTGGIEFNGRLSVLRRLGSSSFSFALSGLPVFSTFAAASSTSDLACILKSHIIVTEPAHPIVDFNPLDGISFAKFVSGVFRHVTVAQVISTLF